MDHVYLYFSIIGNYENTFICIEWIVENMVKNKQIARAEVTSRNRVSVPAKVVHGLCLDEGDFVSFEKNDRGEVVLKKMIVTYPD